MSAFPGPWGFAGGWAIDLFLGRQSRPHSDIDVALLRGDQRHIRARLPAGQVQKVVDHCLSPWGVDEDLQPPVHEVHAAWPDGFRLELLLNEHDEQRQRWVFRRDYRIGRPVGATFLGHADLPYLAPEVVLLYKAKAAAAKDDADLFSALPHLSADQRGWLRDALALTAPGHRWGVIMAPEP